MTRTAGVLCLTLLLLLALPAATATEHVEGGLLVRARGEVFVGPNETLETLVLYGEETDGHVAGTVGVIMVFGGTLNLTGTVLDEVVLVNAHANLENGSHVQGSVQSFDSSVDRHPDALVDGGIERGSLTKVGPLASLVFGIIFLIGVPLALLAAALLAVAFFPHQVRSAGATLTRDAGATLLTTALVWFGLPFIAFLLFFTLVGIPLAVGIGLVLLPLLWIGGFIIAGVRLGDLMLSGWGKRPLRPHPYLGAVLGILLLVLVGMLPLIGLLTVSLAGLLGAGALVLTAWRAAPRLRRRRPRSEDDAPWDPSAGGA